MSRRSQMVLGSPSRESAWSARLGQLCVWQTFGLLTTHRQDPSCSTGACQLGTQMGLWESQASVYQSLDVTPLSQTSMPPLSLRASPQRRSICTADPLRWGSRKCLDYIFIYRKIFVNRLSVAIMHKCEVFLLFKSMNMICINGKFDLAKKF